jgi:hypothetical protein
MSCFRWTIGFQSLRFRLDTTHMIGKRPPATSELRPTRPTFPDCPGFFPLGVALGDHLE